GIGYTGQAADFVKPLDGIRNELNGSGIEVLYARGTDILESDVDAEPGFAEAVDVAGRADVAVVFVGTHREIEREGRDRTFLNLQPIQQDLVRRVAAANPNTAVVMVNAGPLSLTGGQPSMEPPPAVLMMFMAGEEGGNAVADILFGDYNPAGRLPYTVYYSHEDVPGWEEYDISKGYTYMYFDGQPEWPFGHGLSYTTFEYGDLETSTSSLPGDGEITVSVDVRNTGDVAGDEVVQLYVRDLQPAVIRPRKQLRGFERISLNPGETRTVTLSLSAEDLAYYDVDQDAFVVQPGPFEVMAGSSSENVRGTATIQVTTSGRWDP
ncbi:MAG: glycoside hydrolase family 3 C-terminal domain-containing protein, partial [Longimicrobiales bacterium]